MTTTTTKHMIQIKLCRLRTFKLMIFKLQLVSYLGGGYKMIFPSFLLPLALGMSLMIY